MITMSMLAMGLLIAGAVSVGACLGLLLLSLLVTAKQSDERMERMYTHRSRTTGNVVPMWE